MKSPRRLRPFVSLALASVAVLWSLDRADSADPVSRTFSFDAALERLGIRGHLKADAIRFDATERAFCGTTDPVGYEFSLKTDAPVLHLRRKDSDFGLTLRMTGNSWRAAEQKSAMVVYSGPDVAAVYRPTNDGVKEDVVVRTSDALQQVSLVWNLELPSHLEARLLSDGSIGIYGPDTFLWGAISTQDDSTAALIEKARRKAPRTQLLYRLPKPQIVDGDRKVWPDLAHYDLRDKTVSIGVSPEVRRLAFPISIDPTVVLTTTADFSKGNNEGNVSFATADQLTRGTLTSGRTGSWTATTSFTVTARLGNACVAHNGFLYVIGGLTSTSVYSPEVQYAAINANGTVGTWTSTSSLITGRVLHAAVVYNNRMYVLGGEVNSTPTYTASIEVATINATGTLGTWTSVSSIFTTARTALTAVAHSGFMYVLGGQTTSAPAFTNDVQYAAIKGDGTLGAWTAASNLFVTPRGGHASVAYQGYVYVIGGQTAVATYTSAVTYAEILSTGDLGSWRTASPFGTALGYCSAAVYNGHLYKIGGWTGSEATTVEFAPILGSGLLGAWTATTALGTAHAFHASAAYNGYLYLVGGRTSVATTGTTDVLYSSIETLGTVGSWSTDGDTFTTARRGHTSVAYNGYLYVIGGEDGSTPYLNTTYFASINSDGSVNGFTAAANNFSTARSGHTSVVYNGRLYVIGGYNGGYLKDVQFSTINSSGNLGVWASTTDFHSTTGRRWHTSVMYKQYVYVIGGDTGSNSSNIRYAAIDDNGTIGSSAWADATSLPQPLSRHSSVVYGSFLYVLGGFTTDYAGAVYYASIGSTGSLGSFNTTTALPTVRANHTSVAYNGYLYVMGGQTTGSHLNDVRRAPINANGSLGAFATADPSFTTGRREHTSVAYQGTLYVVGGFDGGSTYFNTVQYAPVNIHGTARSWTATTSFTPGARYGHAAVASNGYLYLLGGYDNASFSNTVHYATINSDGTVGAWTATSTFTSARFRHAALVYKGYMYVLGGQTAASGGHLNDVQYAAVNSDGTVGSWTTTSAFTTARSRFGAAAYRGFLYVSGGSDAGDLSLADVQYAAINSNGTLGTFSTTTSASIRYGHGCVAYNGYLYIAGGYNSTLGSFLNDVWYAAIGSNGTLGGWIAAPSFLGRRQGLALTAANGFLYLVGGSDGSAAFKDVQFAPVSSSGTLGNWNETTPLPTSQERRNHAVAIYNGILYVLAGADFSGTALSSVYYAPLSPLQRAIFSTLIDLGSDQTVNSFLVNGTTTNLGDVRLRYRLATSASAVFGSESSIDPVTLGSSSTISTTARYVWLRIILDDLLAAAINPDATNARDVTDVTVDYGAGSGGGSSSSDDHGGRCSGSVGQSSFSGYLLWLAALLALLPLLRRRG